MNNEEFINLLTHDLILFITLVTIFTALYLLIFSRILFSVFDPLFLPTIFSAIATSTTFFLFFTSQIDFILLMHFAGTQIAFLIGTTATFILFRQSIRTPFPETVATERPQRVWFFFYFFLIIFSGFLILNYYLHGIPALASIQNESRLASYGSTSFSNLKRILDTLSTILPVLSLYLIFFQRPSLIRKIALLFGLLLVLLYGAGLGSKAFLFHFISVAFAFGYIFFKENPFSKLTFPLLIVAVIAAFAVISTYDANFVNYFLYRLAISGDTFYMTYPNNRFSEIESINWFVATFNGLLANLKIIDERMTPLGFSIYQLYYQIADIGPNPRHNVFGLIHYGFIGAFFYSFFIGLLLGVSRAYLTRSRGKGVFRASFSALLLTASSQLETDSSLAISGYLNALLILPFSLLIGSALYLLLSIATQPNAITKSNRSL